MVNSKIDPKKNEIKDEFHAHKKYYKLYFSNDDMDFAFQWLLGSVVHGGCSIGECFYAASLMDDGNPKSWERELGKLAARVEKRGEEILKNGHFISAREQFLRAYAYYRAVLGTMIPNDPKFKIFLQKAISSFKKAAELFDPPIEPISIPFEGKELPGYFIRAKNDEKKHKTLIMIGGGETFAEDQYFYIAPAALKRGYNFLTVDLPGQGGLPFEGLHFRRDTETSLKAVIDYALNRREVDSERLAVYGISAGGYFVPRAAAFEKRIKACIANSVIVNLYKLLKSSILQRVEKLKQKDPFIMRMIDLIAWRWGADPTKPFDLIEKNKTFLFDPSEIKCPMLILIGEDEYNSSKEIKVQQHQCYEALPNPKKKLIIAPRNEGAGHHCLGENLSLMSSFVFDWLDDIFK